jgi:hypothetical protein
MSPSRLPFLLLCDELRGIDVETFWTAGLLQLGRLASANEVPGVRDIERARSAIGVLAHDWERLMAAEWLLAAMAGQEAVRSALGSFEGVHLFGTRGPTAGEAVSAGAAGVLVPLASREQELTPGLAAMFLVCGDGRKPRDDRTNWEGADGFLRAKRLRLYTLRSPANSGNIQGTSWMSGAGLAARCLADRRERTAVLDLARDWLPTGSVREPGRVVAVNIGNKDRLPVGRRRWLLADGQDVSVEASPRAVRIDSLDAAWNVVVRQGTVEEGARRQWPEMVEELHSFVSGAREPVIAATVLARPRKLVLWRTANRAVSRKPSEDIRRILSELRPALEVEFRGTVSDSMLRVEKDLRARLEPCLAQGHSILMNVTQGNRLMGFAAHTLARQHSNLTMVYRDMDAGGLDFTAISYRRDYPTTYTLATDADEPADMDRAELAARHDSTMPWRELLAKIRKKANHGASRLR